MKSNFKKGDKVFVYPFGWGVFMEKDDEQFSIVNYEETDIYCKNELISFTEYTLHGFSQERLIDLPEIGELVMVSDNGNDWLLREVKEIQNGKVYTLSKAWNYFKRLR